MTEFIRLAERHAWPNASASHPTTEALTVVIAAGIRRFAVILGDRQATNLAAPMNERRLQQAALLEILDEP